MFSMPFVLGTILEFAKSFLSTKMSARIEIVGSSEKLMQKLGLSPEALPKELGGTSLALRELTTLWKEEVAAHGPQLRALETLSIDASKIEKTETKKVNWFWNAVWPL